jgi:hypothetical protein
MEETMNVADMSVQAIRISLENQYQDLKQELEQLSLENGTIEHFYDKKRTEMEAEEEERKRRASSRGGSRQNKRQAASVLTTGQKYEISNFVSEDLSAQIDQNKASEERMIDALRAVLEETELHINDLKHAAYEFKKSVVVGGENPRTGRIMVEKVMSIALPRLPRHSNGPLNQSLSSYLFINSTFHVTFCARPFIYVFSLISHFPRFWLAL